MKTRITFLFAIVSWSVYAQTDSIYTNNEKFACTVKELTQDAVKYVYPGEEIINTVYKSTIQKIVFKSGRTQTFAEATSYKTVKGAEDFENVTLTLVESEVNGLFKLGDVSSKAKGTTTLSSMEKVKERANRKMKIVAAMMGANIIYLAQNTTTGNQYGSYFQAGKATETNLNGVAYSNKLPSYNDFEKLIGDKTLFQTYERLKLGGSDSDFSTTQFSKTVQLFKIYNEAGLIMINAKIDGVDNNTFRVTSFSQNEFILVWKDGDKVYNFKIKI